ncbi:hypothetical protein [Bradyrhizobium sp. DOA1]|uniref:hypothetical protein n=1 Tax=Bradyrhizobium sp. DOA1 TaxID=1126616 RepID=UPI0012E772BF|nr:hypothetical protein [Bradyrhizobium sp. DOA1]
MNFGISHLAGGGGFGLGLASFRAAAASARSAKASGDSRIDATSDMIQIAMLLRDCPNRYPDAATPMPLPRCRDPRFAFGKIDAGIGRRQRKERS